MGKKEFEPRPYQQIAIEHMRRNPKCGLFLKPGAGKTVSTLTVMKEACYDDFSINKWLVIAPLRVSQTVWAEEVEEWSHLHLLRCSKVLGTLKKRTKALLEPADVYIINRENVVWLLATLGKNFPFDGIVIDESTTFKNHTSKRFKAARIICAAAKQTIILTGTPAPRDLQNLWPQLYLLDKGERLGPSISFYRNTYFTADSGQGFVVYSYREKPGARQIIMSKISDICLAIDSPTGVKEPIVVDKKVTMDAKEYDVYLKLENDLILEYEDGNVIAPTPAALATKLLQLANGAAYTDEEGVVRHFHDKKLDALEDIITELDGEPVLVFYCYKHDAARIKERFGGRQIATDKDIADWNDGKISVGFAHPASIGHGLNLQFGGHVCVWFGLTPDLELYQQANARLARTGQKKQVIIHRILAKGTHDLHVAKLLEKKEFSQEDLLQGLLYKG